MVSSEIDRVRKQHESEFSSFKLNFEKQLLDAEHRVSILNSELLNCVELKESISMNLESQIENNAQMEKELRDIKWELTDTNRMTASRILELEDVIKKGNMVSEAETKGYLSTIHQLEQTLTIKDQEYKREKHYLESQIDLLNTKFKTKTDEYEDQISKLNIKILTHQDETRQLSQTITSLSNQIDQQKIEYSSLYCQKTNLESVYKNERCGFQERILNLSSELEVKSKEILDLKHDLNCRIQIESDLRQQIDSIKKRYDEDIIKFKSESMKYMEGENLTRGLMLENHNMKQELQNLKNNKTSSDGFVDQALGELQKENENLRGIIYQMRIDMEEATNNSKLIGISDNNPLKKLDHAYGPHNYPSRPNSVATSIFLHDINKKHISRKVDTENNSHHSDDLNEMYIENERLQQELGETRAEISLLLKDKRKLIDISNALRAAAKFELKDGTSQSK